LVNKVVVGWEKSPLDNVKINIDVAQMGNEAFFVVVARDCNGVIILVATKEILIGDYVVVEASAVLWVFATCKVLPFSALYH
jgi:hypothetical protein